MNYKKSRYNLTKKINDDTIIFNLVSNQVAILDRDNFSIYNNCATIDKTNENVSKIIGQLFDLGFIVESDKNEIAFVDLRRHSTMYDRSYEKCFVIFPTTDCNARCYYCYQDEWRPQNMTEETADKVIDFILRSTKDDDKVIVSWFGGEPLYNYKVAKKISDALKAKLGDRYKSNMTSNASLISEELAKELKNDWNLFGIQITIDNLYEKYEATKSYVDGTKFETVINAIGHCLNNGIGVIARINVGKSNINDLEGIYTYLMDKFGHYDNFQIALELLKQESVIGNMENYFTKDEYSKVYTYFLQLKYKYHKKDSINGFLCPQKYCTCMAQSIRHVVISHDGKLYKCQHIHEKDCIGDVDAGIVFNDTLAYFMNPTLDKKCEHCKFLPVCHGGCLNIARYGLVAGSMCTRVKYDYKARLGMIYDIYKKILKGGN